MEIGLSCSNFVARRDGWSRPLPLGAPRPMSFELKLLRDTVYFTDPAYPPAWMLVEILPLGVITRIFENLRDNALKKKIASTFQLPLPVFCSWLTVITLTRNSCCHHSRVWNRTYAVGPMVPKKMNRPWISNAVSHLKTFYEICIIKWFVDIVSPNNNLKDHLTNLFASFPNVDAKAMGFPEHWESEPLWNK